MLMRWKVDVVGEQQAVVEGVAGVDVVAHGDMRQLHGDHGGNRFLAGQAVDESLADQNGVAHGGGFHGVGEQNAAMDLVGKGQIIGHYQVDHDLAQNLVLVAARVKGRHQAGFHQAVDHVVLGLGNPHARSLQRTHILRVVALVHRVIHLHAHVLAVARGQLERVAPEVRLRLQAH